VLVELMRTDVCIRSYWSRNITAVCQRDLKGVSVRIAEWTGTHWCQGLDAVYMKIVLKMHSLLGLYVLKILHIIS